MITIFRRLAVLTLIICSITWSAYGIDGTTISGTVKNSTGAPYRGAFVRVRNVKTTMTFNVLSDSEGRYRVQPFPALIRRPKSSSTTVLPEPTAM